MSPSLMAYWTFISPLTVERQRQRLRLPLEFGDRLGGERMRRQRAGRVAGMDAGFLDVLHDPADEHVLAVGERVDVDLDGVGEVRVDQHRRLARHHHRLGDVAVELRRVVDDLHGAAAEHVRRADDHREADLLGDLARLRRRFGDAVLAAASARASRSASGSGRGPRRGRSCRARCRGSAPSPSPARRRASAASGRRAGR